MDLLMVYRPSLISELIHLSVLHVVLLVDSRLLRGVSPSLGHLSDIRPLFGSVVTWLLELSMTQGNTTRLMVHSVRAERSVCWWSGLVCLNA